MKIEVENTPPTISIGNAVVAPIDNRSSETASYLSYGIRAAQAGNRAEARTALFKVTENDPQNEAAWLWLASISEYPEELLVFLNNVLEINPENERAKEWKTATNSLLAKTFVQRGVDAAEDGRPDFAVDCFNRALEYDQENINAWLWMASLAETNEGKLNYLEMALKVDPENEPALRALANARRSVTAGHLAAAKTAALSGHKADAMELLQAVIDEDPKSVDAWMLKAHFADGFDEKIAAFSKVLDIDPNHAAARYGLDSLRSLMGELAVEIPAVEPVTADRDDDPFAYEAVVEAVPQQEAVEAEESAHEVPTEFAEDKEDETAQEFAAVEDESLPEVIEYEIEPPVDLYNPEQPPMEVPVMDEVAEVTFEASEVEAEPEMVEAAFEASKIEAEPEMAEAAFEAAEETAEVTFEAAAIEAKPKMETIEHLGYTNGHDHVHFDHADETITMASPDSFAHSEEPAVDQEVIEAAPEFSSLDEVPAAPEFSSLDEVPTVSDEPSQDVTEEFSVQDLAAHDIQEISVELPSDEPSIHETVAADIHETQADMPASYNGVVSEQILIKASPSEEPVANDPFETVAEFSIPMPSQQIPEPVEKANPFATKFDPVFVRKAVPVSDLPVTCSFCKATSDSASIQCGTCMAVLTLADLDTILNNEKADRVAIRHAVERMESERVAMNYGEIELTMLGIGHLNLGNLQHGYNYLYEAARINPDNIVLSSQVNALLIRLDDVRKHDETAESMTRGKTILVVDDSATVRKLIAGKLEKCGHTVFCSPDGVDAMAALEDVAPDLILLDINMPRMDGYQTCKAIRSKDETKNIPIVMISGKDGFFDKVRGRMAGTTGYITKPFGPETLMKTVETYLSSNGEPQHPEVISE